MNANPQGIPAILLDPRFVLPLLVWGIFWKGMALWKSASKRQLIWFVLFLFINTVGILEMAYIFYLNRWDIDKGKVLSFLEKKFQRSL